MTIVEGFFDEIGFSESVCSSFAWSGNSLEILFQYGVDLGGSNHPLNSGFKFDAPCRLLFDGVVKSKLRVSHLVDEPNNFEDHYFEKRGLPELKEGIGYTDYCLEGMMKATNPTGWFVWDIVAERFFFDDLTKQKGLE